MNPPSKSRKKSLVAWTYEDWELGWTNWVSGVRTASIDKATKRKKDFEGSTAKKVRITVEEIP